MHPKIFGGPLRALGVLVALAIAGSAAVGQVTLRPGDTLSSVARRYHTTVAAMVSANHLTDPNRVQAGQVLVLPGAPGATHRTRRVGAAGFGPPPTVVSHRLPDKLLANPKRLALRPLFRYWSTAYGVRPDLVEALAWMESGWQNKVVSPTGAIGIGQLEPSTVDFVSQVLIGVKLNPHVANDNIRMTARFLRYLLDQTNGNVAEALGGYYQGLTSVQRQGPMAETVVYVDVILALQPGFRPG